MLAAAEHGCQRKGGRVRSKVSGLGKTSGSRRADIVLSRTGRPAGTTVPSSSISSTVSRGTEPTAGSQRSDSDTTAPMSAGWRRTSCQWPSGAPGAALP